MNESCGVHDGGALVRRSAASTVASLFAARVATGPARPAIEDGVRRLSYAELDRRVRRLAAVLAASGVTPGVRVAVLSENRLEYLELFLAAAVKYWTFAGRKR
jgi:fatty-acyl-CoA synthase